MMERWIMPILLVLFFVPGKGQGKEPFTYCEVTRSAEFPGGMDNLHKFIRENICYPETAERDRVQGKVYIEFVVDTMGEIKNVKIKRSIRNDLDSICLEMMKHMPRWEPSSCNGKKTKQRYMLPVNFKLNGSGNDSKTSITPYTCDELRKKWLMEKQSGK